jgi:predicted transposase YdaD
MLNRFRKLSVKEVIAMLHLNLEETKAGRELISIGEKKGEKKGETKGEKKGELKNSKKLLIDAVNEKFGNIPDAFAASIKRINKKQYIDALFKKVFHCQTIDEFSEAFRQAKI